MRFKKTIVSVAILATAGLSAPSYAFGDSAILIPYLQAISAAVAGTTAAVSAGVTTIMAELVRIENLLGANSAKVAAQVAETSQNQIQRSTDMAKNDAALNVEKATRLPLDPCANAARGLADPSFDRLNPGFSNANGSPFGPRGLGGGSRPKTGSSSLDKAIAIARNDEMAPPPEVQAVVAQRGACEAYAAGGVRAQECRFSGANPSVSSGLPDADVRAATIYDGAQAAGDEGKISLSFNDKQLAAAGAYVRNLSAPVQLRDLTQIEAKTDEGRRYLALRDSFQARLDMAMRPIEEWTSNRTKYKPTIPILQAMMDGNGAASRYLSTHLPQTAPDWRSNGVSMHQLLYIDAARRYDNPEWVKEIAATSDSATLQREQLMLQAQMSSLMTKNLFESQKTNMLLGAIYQASLNRDFMPELAAQHKRATSAR